VKVSDFVQWRRLVAHNPPHLLLVLSEDVEEREQAVTALASALGVTKVHFTSQQFSAALFEISTRQLLKMPRLVCLREIDQLKPEQVKELQDALQDLDADLYVCLEGTTFKGALLKDITERGAVYQPMATKPWEQEKKLTEDLCEQAAHEGVVLSADVAKALVARIGPQRAILHQELQKLICYVGDRCEINLADVQAVGSSFPQQTLWQLGDALFLGDVRSAWEALQGLLQGQMVPLAILSALRTQVETGLKILHLSEEGGAEAVRAQFPYLKGGLYDKKLGILKRCGKRKMQTLLKTFFEVECQMKDGVQDLAWPLERVVLEAR